MSGAPVFLQETPDQDEIWIYGVVEGLPPNFDRKLSVKSLAAAWRDQTFRQLLVSAGAPDSAAEDPTQLVQLATTKPVQILEGNYPDRLKIFQGRQEVLEQLGTILADGQMPEVAEATGQAAARFRRAAVHGMGGLGKSSLAAEYVFRHRHRYSGVWWCEAETRTQLLESLAKLGKALRTATTAEEADLEKAAREALRHLSDQSGNYLLVYDGVPGPDEIKGLYPDAGASVLITSRFSDWNEWAEPVALDLLSEAEAVAILEHRSGRKDPVGAKRLAEVVGYLPLALVHAAAYCKQTLQSFTEGASKLKAIIAKAPRGESYPRSIAATFELQMAEAIKESAAAQPLMVYLAQCAPQPERIPTTLLDGATGNHMERDEALAALTVISLVEDDPFEDTTPAVSVHPVVQMVARASASREETLSAYRNLALTLVGIYPSDGDRNPMSWPKCGRLNPHLLCSNLYVEEHSDEVWGEIFGEHIRPFPSALLADAAGNYFKGRRVYSLSEQQYRTALRLVEKMDGPKHVNTANSLSKLASVLESQGDFIGARQLFERALAIRGGTPEAAPEDTAKSLNSIAHLLWMQGDFAGARPLFERALAILERVLGAEDPDTTTVIHNLASVLSDLGQLEEARPLFERSLAVRERLFGPAHPAVANSLTGLASLFEIKGNLSEARSSYERALAINEKAFGPDHPDIANGAQSLAVVLQKQGNLGEARPLYERALAINEKAFGAEHPQTNHTRYYFATLLLRMGFPAEALSLGQAALAALEKALGPKHSSTKEAAFVTCGVLDGLGRTEEAKSLRIRYERGDLEKP